MSKALVCGSSHAEIAREVIHRDHGSLAGGGMFGIVRLWRQRSQQRRVLGELARQNDALLEDMGISRAQALRESAKPFWQP